MKTEVEYTSTQWVNLNSFVARLFAAQLGFGHFGIPELRVALEDEHRAATDTSLIDCKVRVACEWILRAGRQLLRESLLNSKPAVPPSPHNAADPYCCGPLFHGPRGLSIERWGFWKRRLGKLRQDVGEPVPERIDEALVMMATVETEAATNLAVS